MSTEAHFLIVASHSETKHHYCKKLDSLAVRYSVVESPKELHLLQHNNSFHGLMVDVHNYVRLSAECKNIIKDYTQILPTIKLFVSNNDFIVNYSSFESDNIRQLDDFVSRCSTQPARTIRRNQRYNIYLNVMLDGRQCSVTDLSRTGCFILSTDFACKVGDYIELQVNEFGDKTPITALVRRCVRWGMNFMAAGIGAEFISMSASQREELDMLLAKHIEKISEAEKVMSCDNVTYTSHHAGGDCSVLDRKGVEGMEPETDVLYAGQIYRA